MPSLRVVNVVLVGASLLCVGIIVTQLVRSGAAADTRPRPPAAGPAAPAPAAETPRLPAQAYNVIAARNLFSPTRTETPGPVAGSGPAISIVKPSLHGVVLREGSPIAYLEDPMTKRIAGYRIGDPIAGGTVQTISADAVVISRPDGSVDVRLRDPSKPRPAAPPVPGQPPGQPAAGQPPGQPPGAGQPLPPAQQPAPGAVAPPTQTPRVFTPPPAQIIQPGQPMPGPSTGPFVRPSPSLGRRLPPAPVDPANPQQVPPQN